MSRRRPPNSDGNAMAQGKKYSRFKGSMSHATNRDKRPAEIAKKYIKLSRANSAESPVRAWSRPTAFLSTSTHRMGSMTMAGTQKSDEKRGSVSNAHPTGVEIIGSVLKRAIMIARRVTMTMHSAQKRMTRNHSILRLRSYTAHTRRCMAAWTESVMTSVTMLLPNNDTVQLKISLDHGTEST